MTSPKTQAEIEQAGRKGVNQRSQLRTRIKNIAEEVIRGRLSTLTPPYKPNTIQDPTHPDWQQSLKNQQNLMKRIQAARDAMDGGKSKEELIVSLRADFPELAKKHPPPVKKANQPVPAPAPAPEPTQPQPAQPATSHVNANGTAKRCQQAQEEDMDDDEEYPTTQPTPKRQRPAAPEPADEEELEMQIQEIRMKADLQILQLRRKFAEKKKKKREAAEGEKGKENINVEVL